MTDMWDKKYHFTEIEIPAVKLLGITIQKASKILIHIDCEMGKSLRERTNEAFMKQAYSVNPVWGRMIKQSTRES